MDFQLTIFFGEFNMIISLSVQFYLRVNKLFTVNSLNHALSIIKTMYALEIFISIRETNGNHHFIESDITIL
jgi:hypothetical protein